MIWRVVVLKSGSRRKPSPAWQSTQKVSGTGQSRPQESSHYFSDALGGLTCLAWLAPLLLPAVKGLLLPPKIVI